MTADDTNAVELGFKFQADTNGQITGIRFYKGPQNTGPHVADLWSSTGTLLATATFSNETASGWQQVNFSNPVAITAGTTTLLLIIPMATTLSTRTTLLPLTSAVT